LKANPKKSIINPSLTPAAVLLLLYLKDGEYCVLLNKRTDRVEHHKGEISFPGGVRDESDFTLLETALRETQEEMGIAPRHVELLGELDDTPTSTSFLITPSLALSHIPTSSAQATSRLRRCWRFPCARCWTPPTAETRSV
jgi:8-oxo-dGTP pyrophosphatase MutT (NUDIX family)